MVDEEELGRAVELALGPDAGGSARELLRSVVASCKAEQRDLPAREAYALLDRLFAAHADDAAKAELLLDLLDVSHSQPVTVLLTNALLCSGDAAFSLLFERFAAAGTPDALYASNHVLYGLCRTGARFADALLAELDDANPERQLVALAGAEALARCFVTHIPAHAAEQRADEVREREKFPPLRREDVGRERLAGLAARVAALVDRADGARLPLAIRTLGRLGAESYANRVHARLRHPDPATRTAAILTLAELGDVSAFDAFCASARSGETAERCAAVGALARLRVREAEALLVELCDDPDPKVQEAAVGALGDIDTDLATEVLGHLLRAGNRKQRNAASKALFRTWRRPEPSPLARRRAEKIRGDARPFAHQSLGAAIRFALDELRAYEERELTSRIARVCGDYSSVRRFLVEEGLMQRERGTYTFTQPGAAVWRVERFIQEHYLERS